MDAKELSTKIGVLFMEYAFKQRDIDPRTEVEALISSALSAQAAEVERLRTNQAKLLDYFFGVADYMVLRCKEIRRSSLEDLFPSIPPDAKEVGLGKYMNLWKCPKCGGNTNTYRHPYAKVWCESCGYILREEGDQTIIHRVENPMRKAAPEPTP